MLVDDQLAAEIFSIENGFTNDAIVSYSFFNGKGAVGVNFFNEEFLEDLIWAVESDAEVRVHSGPMSIWNYAPDRARYVTIEKESNDVSWFENEPPIDNRYAHLWTVLKRPWWAKKQKVGEVVITIQDYYVKHNSESISEDIGLYDSKESEI